MHDDLSIINYAQSVNFYFFFHCDQAVLHIVGVNSWSVASCATGSVAIATIATDLSAIATPF